MWVSSYRTGAPPVSPFPLSISGDGRGLVSPDGTRWLMAGDAIWDIEVQATNAEIDIYLNDRQSRGFNTILCQCIESQYSNQSPAYNNVDGIAPFATMSPTDFSVMVTAYWNRVIYLVAGAKSRGMLVLLFPAYMGFSGGSQGWMANLTADTAAHLQAYGTAWANLLLPYNNVIPLALGDYVPTTTERDKQWNIFGSSGILSVRPGQPISGHASRTNSAYSVLSPLLPFQFLNTIYCPKSGECDNLAAVEYARSGPYPFFLIEDGYEGEAGMLLANVRRSHYTSMFSGAIGVTSSNANWWPLGSTAGGGATGSVATILSTYNNTTGTQQRLIAFNVMRSKTWWKLVPQLGTGLVTSSLGTSGTAARVCAALASDGSFGFVYKNDALDITINLANFAQSSIRLRWMDPTTGGYTAIGTFLKSLGTQLVTHPGNNAGGDTDWVMVAD